MAERARPEARYLGLLEQALERCPPGRWTAQTAERLAPHLARALDRCLVAGCELAARRPQAPRPASCATRRRRRRPWPPCSPATCRGPSLYERRTEGLGTEPWAPYLIAKARALAARGRVDEAREALALVHLSWQRRPLYWQARAEVARAAGDAGGRAVARRGSAALARRTWPATDWTWHRGVARLEMLTGRAGGRARA